MFSVGEKVFYGHMGVCEVKDIAVPSFCAPGEVRRYYELCPGNQSGSIFVPVDTDAYMRRLLNREEVERLIDMIPGIRAQAVDDVGATQLKQRYAEAMGTHACEDLIELIMSIYAKKQSRIRNNQKIGAIDTEVMRRAEELLYSEFALALGIEKDAVPAYIASRIQDHGAKKHRTPPVQ